MQDRRPDAPPARTSFVDVVEILLACVACAAIAAVPIGIAMAVAGWLGPGGGIMALAALCTAAFVLPARVPMPDRPELDGYQRWGVRMGRLFRAPIVAAERRRAVRRHRALSSSTAASSAAAPALPPRR